jgi:hypothetical protein
MRSTCLTASLLILSALCVFAQEKDHPAPDCRIIGTVIDAEGKPVPNVIVEANSFVSQPATPDPVKNTEPSHEKEQAPQHHQKWLEEDVSWLIEMPAATTNEAGGFEFPDLGLMTYELRGGNDEYPSAPLAFTDGSPAEVTLTRDVPIAHVVVKLGAKGGVVTGLVTDKQTGKPVRAGYELFRIEGNSQMFASSASPDFHFLIPSSLAVSLRVLADGYKQLNVPLRFEPGEKKLLNLELEPDPASRHRTLKVVPVSGP